MAIIPTKLDSGEIARRQKLVLEKMKEEGVDCLVLFNHSTWYPGPMKYLFDYSHQYPTGALFSAEGIKHYGHCYFDPDIPENDPSGRLPEKRITYAPMVNATWADYWMADRMLEEIRQKGWKKIGFAGMQYVPAAIYKTLTEGLKDCEFCEFSKYIDRIRQVKSPYEISVLEELVDIHEKLLDDAANFMRVGITGKELCNYVIKCAADRGCTEFNIMGGPYMPGNINVAGTGGINGNLERTIEGGYALLMIECAGPSGQWCELSRIFSFGQPSDEMLKGTADAIRFQERAAELCVPGAIPQEIMAEINDMMEASGYYREPRVCIHGQSYEIVDMPYFGPGEVEPLQDNSFLAIHPEAGNASLRCNITDNYLVTPNGARRMMKSSRDIIVI